MCWPLCFRVRRGPYLACVLHLAAADSLSLGCTALALLEEVFELGPQPTLQAATTLHPVSRCCDLVELCLLAALSIEGSLGVLAPAWSCRCRPGDLSRVCEAGFDLHLLVLSFDEQVAEILVWEQMKLIQADLAHVSI
ncbi:hypothetical protein E5288_WYG016106 [Bos mutus]|uniref:Secreted protein n=1 Tax=Bos mutus TaxID=72004 RepID=A0A6B0RR37_9CETA|nr:hypothetical protein [Bos mutus]